MGMKTKQISLGPTDASGDFSVDVTLQGLVKGIGLVIGTLANTADLTITDKLTGAAIFSKSNVSANALYQPKAIPVGVTGTALNTAGDVAYESPACLRTMHIVVAQGGDTKTGTLYVLIEG
jgi:hypothetical protein